MAGFTPDYLFPTVTLPGQTHRFAFGGSLSQYQISNLFPPTLNNPSQNCLELLNGNSSGFRFRQVTMSSNVAGSLIIENFINGSIPGSPLLTFNENGPIVLSPSGTNAVQLKNNSAVTPLQFYNSSGTFYAALQAGNMASNVTWTLPTSDSIGTQAIVSNGAGALSFATFGVGNVTTVSGTTNRISVTNGTTTPVIDIASTYVGQTSITTLGTIASGVWNGTVLGVPYGGTGLNTFTPYSIICAGTTATGAFQNVSGLGTSGQVLASAGASALPTWVTPTMGTVTSVTGTALQINVTNGTTTPVISIAPGYIGQTSITTLGTITAGTWNGSIVSPIYGGTGINNGANTITLGGSLTTSGAFASTFTMTGVTGVTFPTSGTLATTSQLPSGAALTKADDTNVTLTLGGTPATALLQAVSITAGWTGQLSLSRGGTNANLTASPGGMVYSTSTGMGIMAGTSSINKVLLSTIFSAPVWSSLSYPTSAIAGQLIYASSPISLDALATANNGVLITSGTGIPSISSTLPSAVQSNITALGTIASGIWNGTAIGMGFGGTNANLTASPGGMVYSTSTGLAILSGTATASKMLMSGAFGAPTWSTATYPSTTGANQLIYSTGSNTVGTIPTANDSTLMTNSLGAAAWQTTASNFVTSIAGTALQITASASIGAVTLSLPSDVVITSSLTAGNIMLLGNTIQSHDVDGNINIVPNGNGNVNIVPATGTISLTSNVGFGMNISGAFIPHSAIQTANIVTNRVITLFEGNNNTHEFYGFGMATNTLTYNVHGTTGIHGFYCSTSSSASRELMRITAGSAGGTGAVGINQSSPLAGLHIVGGVINLANEESVIRAENSLGTTTSTKIEIKNTLTGGKLYEIRSNSNGSLDIVDRTTPAGRITLLTDGKLGIATTTPSYLLDVNGTTRATKLLGNANAPTPSLGLAGVVGTGATSSIVGSELGGVFTLNTGTGISGSGAVASFGLSFAMPSSTFSVVFTPASTPISAGIYAAATSASTFTLSVNAALTGSTTYKWNYQIVGY